MMDKKSIIIVSYIFKILINFIKLLICKKIYIYIYAIFQNIQKKLMYFI